MTDLIVPSKRPRVPNFADKHSDYSETHAAATTVASDWLKEKDVSEVEVNKFLDLCGFCKKKLRHDEDIFMYGYFGAFCSKVCRTKQMACDMFKESSREIAKAKKGRMCEGIEPKDQSKYEALGNRDMISSPRFYI